MQDPIDRAIRAISRRHSFALIWAQFGLAHVVVFTGPLLLNLYVDMRGRPAPAPARQPPTQTRAGA